MFTQLAAYPTPGHQSWSTATHYPVVVNVWLGDISWCSRKGQKTNRQPSQAATNGKFKSLKMNFKKLPKNLETGFTRK